MFSDRIAILVGIDSYERYTDLKAVKGDIYGTKHRIGMIDALRANRKDENEQLKLGRVVQEKLSLWLDKRRKKYRLIIYEVL